MGALGVERLVLIGAASPTEPDAAVYPESMGSVLVYDGDCAFCTSAAAWIAQRAQVQTQPWQTAPLNDLGLSVPQVQSAVWLVDEERRGGSRAVGGADAIAAVLRRARSPWWRGVGAVLQWPLVRSLARVGYRIVARCRRFLPGASAACALPSR
ncbi:MAG: DUF393 domain-containing protein [Microbacterium sp.]